MPGAIPHCAHNGHPCPCDSNANRKLGNRARKVSRTITKTELNRRRDKKMNTSSLTNIKKPVGHSHSVITLDCSNLHINDLIIIRTQNNLYRFLITDAQARRGRLIGEWRKYYFPNAILIGALIRVGEQMETLASRLQTAAQALFLVRQGNQKMQLTTSVIIALGWFINREE
jgi:hypothetical protein